MGPVRFGSLGSFSVAEEEQAHMIPRIYTRPTFHFAGMGRRLDDVRALRDDRESRRTRATRRFGGAPDSSATLSSPPSALGFSTLAPLCARLARYRRSGARGRAQYHQTTRCIRASCAGLVPGVLEA